eukprot:GHVU01167585.1.p1 GENE.GHVU01167585.1~~GHVU01167585.1.p1  ORF type:complete len:298 (+),score=63.86 GHVU01167585.1:128-895(+)
MGAATPSSSSSTTFEGPNCLEGCVGAAPTYNGQVLDHAMPSGFVYKLWLLVGEPMHYNEVETQCVQFDFDYTITFEQRESSYQLLEHSYNCARARLPRRLVQRRSDFTEDQPVGSVQGRVIELRDRYQFPAESGGTILHKLNIEVGEPSVIRVTTYQATMDIRLMLTTQAGEPKDDDDDNNNGGDNEKKKSTVEVACKSVRLDVGKHAHEYIHCELPPASYTLTIVGDYSLGGIAPCDYFYLQLALWPIELLKKV